MADSGPGARWQQLRARVLASEEGRRAYQAGDRRAATYRQTMRMLDELRQALGITQAELARRMDRSQPTVARLLTQGENPTLASLEEVLRGLGLRGRLIIEEGEPGRGGLTVEVQDGPTGRQAPRKPRQNDHPVTD